MSKGNKRAKEKRKFNERVKEEMEDYERWIKKQHKEIEL